MNKLSDTVKIYIINAIAEYISNGTNVVDIMCWSDYQLACHLYKLIEPNLLDKHKYEFKYMLEAIIMARRSEINKLINHINEYYKN